MRAAVVVAAGAILVSALAAPAEAQSAGYALRFDGTTDLVRLNATSSMMAATWPTTKTVSLWVNATGAPPACTASSPSSCDSVFGDRPRSWGVSRGVINGQDRLWIWNYDGTVDAVAVEYTTGAWMQIALVHGSGTLSAYKNGVLVGSVPSGSTQGTGQVLHFGGVINSASKNWTFGGEIDEIQIWNVARSAAEIAQSIFGPLVGTELGLAAYYRMTEGSGTSLTDDSGHGWTGALLDGSLDVPGNGPILWVPSGAFGSGPPVPNTPPVADPQSLTTEEDVPVPVTLSGSDADGDPLTFRVTAPPSHGVLTGSAPNLTYTPAANFNGSDSFAFVANDSRVDSAPAVVSLAVTAVNDPPIASNNAAVTAIDTPVTIPVLANDSDADGDPLTITAVTQPPNGTASNGTTDVQYTPQPGFTGTDTFTYTIGDGQGGFATANVTVTVTQGGADPGFALRFDGVSDYVTLAKTSLMLAPGWQTTKTVSLWVKPEGPAYCIQQGPGACDAIFGDRPRWWGISRGPLNGLDRIWVWNYDGTGSQIIGIPYTPGEWVHVALVHGGGLLSAYRNGVLIGSLPSGATQQPNPPGQPTLQLGGVINNAARAYTFQGEIDEVQFWNQARTTVEIKQDMSGPLSGAELGLAAYYGMSNGSGTVLTDDSGHGWTGTLKDGGDGVPPDGAILWVPSGAFSVPPPQ